MFRLGGSARKNYQSGTNFSDLLRNKSELREGILSDLSELSDARKSRLAGRRSLIPLSLLAQQEGLGQIRKPMDIVNLLSALGTDERTFGALGKLDDIKLKEKKGDLEDKLTALKIMDDKDKKFAFEKRLDTAKLKRKQQKELLRGRSPKELQGDERTLYKNLQADLNYLLGEMSQKSFLFERAKKQGTYFDIDKALEDFERISNMEFQSGGRVGYQEGTPDPMLPREKPVEAVDDRKLENIMQAAPAVENPGEVRDMAFDDPKKVYESLRRRLPREITNDIVRLITYNQEAFADFADISDQSDVDSFNEKYNVQLVIPVEEVS